VTWEPSSNTPDFGSSWQPDRKDSFEEKMRRRKTSELFDNYAEKRDIECNYRKLSNDELSKLLEDQHAEIRRIQRAVLLQPSIMMNEETATKAISDLKKCILEARYISDILLERDSDS
jgi:hypothetical protein